MYAPQSMEDKKYGRGKNPASTAHAKLNKGRPKYREIWGEDAITRNFKVTPSAVKKFDQLVVTKGFKHRSDYIQHAGAELVPILPKKIDYKQAQEILAKSGFNELGDLLQALCNGEAEIIINKDENI